ncbi:cyclin-dependent kinase 2-associated protein 1-like [Arctopsyche grandis]|uniref:cyclin-dependent kinase 2-associated protein 1-like n=1 Tax=Arctopsyche grandis TaxID=121162 RepID=UPI00406D6319
MDAMDIQAVESKLSDVTVTAIPMTTNKASFNNNDNGVSKYAQLLAVIEEMGKDVRPSYSGSRSSAERLKRGIVNARILVRECLMETERSARQ